MQSAEWPGNVRELRNALSRLLILMPAEQKGAIHADMLPADLGATPPVALRPERSEEHTSELQSLMRISYAVFCLKKKKIHSVYDKSFYTKTKLNRRAHNT